MADTIAVKADGNFIKRKNFTPVSNIALHDYKHLSVSAIGLYAIICSYINIPNFVLYKSYLVHQLPLGERAFNRAWSELKDNGYLKQYRIRTQGGFTYQYDLLDEPDMSTPGLINICMDGSISTASSNKKAETKQEQAESIGTPETEPKEPMQEDMPDPEDNIDFSDIRKVEAIVKENLSYETLKIDYKERPDFLQSVIRIITDTVCSDNETVIIGKVHRPLWKVRQQLMRLDENHINYVDECLSNSKTEIHNIKAYLLAMLYNAPDTMDAYYTTKVNRDMAVGRTPGEE